MKGANKMEMKDKTSINYFKDRIWDLINEDNILDVKDIESNDKEDYYIVTVYDGTKYKITFSEIEE